MHRYASSGKKKAFSFVQFPLVLLQDSCLSEGKLILYSRQSLKAHFPTEMAIRLDSAITLSVIQFTIMYCAKTGCH